MDKIYNVAAVEPSDGATRLMVLLTGEPVWSNQTLADLIGGGK
jgi:hypothetical protein